MNFQECSDWVQNKPINEAIESCRKSGLRYIGSGSTRVVFKIPNKNSVVKFSKGNSYQNKTEVEVWKRAPNELRTALLPINTCASDYAWITMPEAERVRISPKDLKRIREKIRKTGWRCKDTTPSNIGRYRDKIVVMDYGSGCGPSGLGNQF